MADADHVPYTDDEAAKKLCDAVNDSRGHTQGRNPVQHAIYNDDDTFEVLFRSGEVVTVTVSVAP